MLERTNGADRARWMVAAWLATSCGASPSPLVQVPEASETVPSADTASTRSPTSNGVPTGPPSVYAWLSALDTQGFDAGEGRIHFQAADNCCAWDDCLHMNPGSEYGAYALPPGPGEYTADRQVADDGTILAWRLRDDEAVVYVGPPPPGAVYASFRTYVHDVAVLGGRLETFESLGDTLNHVVWQTNPDGTLLVVTTASAATLALLEQAAAGVGWPTINLDAIPLDVPRMGLGKLDDTFHTTVRMVGLDRAVLDPWLAAPTGRVFRLTPRTASPGVPLISTSLTPVELPPLSHDIAPLRDAIVAAHPDHEATDLVLEPLDPPADGPCWSGCNRDVSYLVSSEMLVGPEDRLVAYGVDPAAPAVGRAVWTSLVLHGMGNSDAAGAFGTTELAGTAQAYVPDAPEELYAVTFARDCAGISPCIVVPEACPGVELDELAKMVWRHYLDPATGTFPPHGNLGEQGLLRLTPSGGGSPGR